MAVLSKHPAAPAPSAPVRETTGHLLLRGWCAFVLFSALAGLAWVNALGTIPAAALTAVTAVVSLVVWSVVRPPVHWRRLPWHPLSYVAWALLSITWSVWPGVSALTWGLMAVTTFQALFVAAMLTWNELVAAMATALKWCVGLSLLFELAVSVFLRGPLLPQFQLPHHHYNPIVYWSRANILHAGRIQGIFGNANPLAAVCLIAIIVFAVRIAAGAPRRVMLGVWIAVAAYLMYRASSATIYLALVAVVLVLCTVLIMRRTRTPTQRTVAYGAFIAAALAILSTAWLLRDHIFAALGRNAELTGRLRIWHDVLERTAQRPVFGWGFATPWLPTDPHFHRWIVDHGQSVMQAHDMWVDSSMQLGIVGVVLLALLYIAFIWRAWFFAVDRPRWDLRADRSYSALSLLPTLVATVLLVQGAAESEPLLLWGWMFTVMLVFKIKQSPHVGAGSIETRLAIERGDLPRSEPARPSPAR